MKAALQLLKCPALKNIRGSAPISDLNTQIGGFALGRKEEEKRRKIAAVTDVEFGCQDARWLPSASERRKIRRCWRNMGIDCGRQQRDRKKGEKSDDNALRGEKIPAWGKEIRGYLSLMCFLLQIGGKKYPKAIPWNGSITISVKQTFTTFPDQSLNGQIELNDINPNSLTRHLRSDPGV